jgi:GDP-L-fucose synthase
MGALIGKFVRASVSGDPSVEVWGDGSQEREFLYIEDAVRGIIDAAEGATSELLNLGTGEAHTIGDIARWIKESAGYCGSIRHNIDRFVGVRRRLLNVARARQELGWTAETPIQTGIGRTVSAYQAELRGCIR